MPWFRKLPVVVEAVQFTGTNLSEIADVVGYELRGANPCERVVIETMEGDMTAKVGDWIIRGVAGEAYPCDAEIFEATYEPAPEG